MKSNKLTAVLTIVMSLTLISCSDDKSDSQQIVTTKEVKQLTTETSIISYIPADTPILAIYYNDPQNPIPENLTAKMKVVIEGVGNFFKVIFEDNYQKYAKDEEQTNEVMVFIDKWFSDEGLKKLGLSLGDNEIAIYAIDLFPVLRMTLANDHSMGEVLDEFMAKINESKTDTASKKDVNGTMVYQFGDKELQLLVSTKGNSLVVSLAPTREVDKLMAKLLGFEMPTKTLVQSNQYQDTLSKYNYLRNNIYWLNLRQLADYFVNPDQYDTVMLDMLKVQDNLLSADCKTEILETFDKFPRLVGGYTELTEHRMNSQMVIEMTDGLGSKLASMIGRIPKTSTTDAVLSYGFSFNLTEAKRIALEFVNAIDSNPYKCEHMAVFNAQAQTFKAKLEQPLPMFVDNFKGANIIINELDLDLTKTDPKDMVKKLKAKMLLAVDNPETLQGMAEMMMPDLQKLGIKAGGDAINISELIPVKGSQIPINLDHVFFAMGDESFGFSIGEGSDSGLTQDVAADASAELLNFTVTAELYKKLFSEIDQLSGNMTLEAKKKLDLQKIMMSDMIWWDKESGSLNFTDNGFEVQVDIQY